MLGYAVFKTKARQRGVYDDTSSFEENQMSQRTPTLIWTRCPSASNVFSCEPLFLVEMRSNKMMILFHSIRNLEKCDYDRFSPQCVKCYLVRF